MIKDIFSLSNDEKYKLLVDCIKNNYLDLAFSLWGVIEFGHIDEKKYYLAAIYMKMRKTEEAVFYAKSVKEPGIKENAELLILESYSKSGMIEKFTDYFANSFSSQISLIEFINYLYDLLFKIKYHLNSDNERYNSLIDMMFKAAIKKCNTAETKEDLERYYINSVQYVSLYLGAIKESKMMIDIHDKEGIEHSASTILGCYNVLMMCAPQFALEYNISKFENEDFSEQIIKFYENIKQCFSGIGKTEKEWFIYYSILERVVDDELLIKEVYEGLDRFPKMIEMYREEAVYPLLMAYGKAFDRGDESTAIQMEKVLLELGISDDTVLNATVYNSVISILNEKAVIAYKGACILYNLAKQNDYEQNDAGPVSLAFYRIIELISNDMIWKPIIDELSLEEINNLYDSLGSAEKNNWRILIKIFNNMYDQEVEDAPGLMIGNLRYLMKLLHESNNSMSLALREKFVEHLKEEGVEAFENGLIDDWYSEENASKFRNPPAHAKYLHFEVLEQCKLYVDTQLINLGKWFKLIDA